ncbi:MAG TPA: SDR family NAD(P)-dependent oxidoreductase [Candidatus Dormibacteraeota bacterium]|nr:SDR family NAD(P)-dependent oxidoreductase [Candidatus Dormibacteraeota bacterium]
MTRFEGKVAVITGSGRGIGAACATRLAEEGASVVVSDMDPKTTEETAARIASAGGRAKGIACDVTDRESVEKLIAGAVDAFGRLDVLVCCAGIIRDNLIYKMTDEDWDGVIDTHLKGTFFAARAAQKAMVEHKYGRMIFMSSTSALGNRGQTNYSTAKAGLQGMARTLAIELGRYNITVNAIAPGFIETAMTRQTADRMGMDFEQFKTGAASQIPVQRIGQPEDIAAAVAYLASEEAGFVSGQVLYVRGGP